MLCEKAAKITDALRTARSSIGESSRPATHGDAAVTRLERFSATAFSSDAAAVVDAESMSRSCAGRASPMSEDSTRGAEAVRQLLVVAGDREVWMAMFMFSVDRCSGTPLPR